MSVGDRDIQANVDGQAPKANFNAQTAQVNVVDKHLMHNSESSIYLSYYICKHCIQTKQEKATSKIMVELYKACVLLFELEYPCTEH